MHCSSLITCILNEACCLTEWMNKRWLKRCMHLNTKHLPRTIWALLFFLVLLATTYNSIMLCASSALELASCTPCHGPMGNEVSSMSFFNFRRVTDLFSSTTITSFDFIRDEWKSLNFSKFRAVLWWNVTPVNSTQNHTQNQTKNWCHAQFPHFKLSRNIKHHL